MATAFSDPIWRKPQTASTFQSLPNGERVDLAIVGGGIMGLSTALHAARLGLSVQVLDAGEIGQGASGLNGGQVIPGLKYDPEWLLEHFGPE
ncbi:MAG: FAD-binding oxidoreductase, partial [Mesorhizobium sp.]